MSSFSNKVEELLSSQLVEWPLAKSNFKALEGIRTKEFDMGGFTIRVQFNPARIVSSSAKVDEKSIKERKCFLCPANLPSEQRGVPFKEEYQVLVNPFPIFPEHFTIPTFEHVDQLIFDRYPDMLDLAKQMNRHTVFYNGPKCGASAPDHAHFQAGNKGFLPIEEEINKIEREVVLKRGNSTLYAIKRYMRNSFLIESDDREAAIELFNKLYSLLELKEGDEEPMMNILVWFEEERWYSVIFPREVHRPKCYYAEGDDNILMSPASVDLGGAFITPLEKDFNKITKEDIEAILKEICISDEAMEQIIEKFKR